MSLGAQRARPAVWGPVLIAALFLAVIGASAGWVLGQQERQEQQAADQAIDAGQDPGGGADVPVGTGGDQTGDPGGDQGGDDGGHQQTGGGASPERCPAHTVELARQRGATGQLERVLYIRTVVERVGTQVWICRDAAGTLFYQGHQYGKSREFQEGSNALFLATVEERGDRYVAVNEVGGRRTVYQVSSEGLWQGQAGDGSDPFYPANKVSH